MSRSDFTCRFDVPQERYAMLPRSGCRSKPVVQARGIRPTPEAICRHCGRVPPKIESKCGYLGCWSVGVGNGEPGLAGVTGIGLPNSSGKGRNSAVTGFDGMGCPSDPGKGRNSDGVAAVA